MNSVNNNLINADIDRIANKIWHFREFFDVLGDEDDDRVIASDFWNRGWRRTHRVYRALLDLFHDELQDKILVEEAEKIKDSKDDDSNAA